MSAVLFNGGVMHAARFRERMVEVLSSWRGAGGVRVLAAAHPDLAVAEGAAVYGLARRGSGVRIRGGTARAYYVGVETAAPAVPGMAAPVKALCRRALRHGRGHARSSCRARSSGWWSASRRSSGSSDRRCGATTGPGPSSRDGSRATLEELPPLEATLDADGDAGRTVPVRLRAHVTELGTLELWCVARDGARRWKLEFNVRQAH